MAKTSAKTFAEQFLGAAGLEMVFDGPFEGSSKTPAESDNVQFSVPAKYNTPQHDGSWQANFYLKGGFARVHYTATTPDDNVLKLLSQSSFYNSLRQACESCGWKFDMDMDFATQSYRAHITISKRVRLKKWESDAKLLRTFATHITNHLKAREIKTRGG